MRHPEGVANCCSDTRGSPCFALDYKKHHIQHESYHTIAICLRDLSVQTHVLFIKCMSSLPSCSRLLALALLRGTTHHPSEWHCVGRGRMFRDDGWLGRPVIF